jgi:RNA polymerase sigma factor (sigma-70 family)
VPNLNHFFKLPILTKAQELKLIRQYKRTGSLQARNTLINCNVRYAIAYAKKYAGTRDWLVDEFTSACIESLFKSVEKYDPSFGVKFISYAHFYMRLALSAANLKSKSVTHIKSRTNRAVTYRTQQAIADAEERFGRSEEATAMAARQLGIKPDSLKARKLFEVMADEILEPSKLPNDAPSPEEQTIDRLDGATDKARLEEALKSLSKRELEILRLRTMSDEPEKLIDLGKEYGVSRERIRQIESKALGKLRKVLAA